jgi:hypothetical protein
MRWLLCPFWRSILVLGTLVGILYLPVDLAGLPEAFKPIRDTLMLVEREWLLAAWATVLCVGIVWRDIRSMLLYRPPTKLSKADQVIVANRAIALADRIEEARNHLGPDGWPNTGGGNHLAIRVLMEAGAFSDFLATKGIDIPDMPSGRADADELARFLRHAQTNFFTVGSMLGTASAKQLDAALRQRQKEIAEEYNVDARTGEPLSPQPYANMS